MLNFFKSNNPAVVGFYLIYLIAFRICAWFIPVDQHFAFEHREPLSQLVFSALQSPLQKWQWLSWFLAGALCFMQALFINYLVNENKVVNRKNYLGGLIFIIAFSFFKQGLVLSPAALALFFLVLCMQRLFSLVKKEKAFGDVFDVGFLVAVATLFYFPSVIFIVFAFVGMATVRAFAYKEWVIVLMGFFTPFIVVFTWYFWNDQQATMLADIINRHQGWLLGAKLMPGDWISIGGLTFFILVALTLLPGTLYSSLIQVRKFSTMLVLFMFLIGVAFLLQQNVNLSHLVLLALPVSVIFSMVLMQIKKGWITEVVHLILILLLLAGQYL